MISNLSGICPTITLVYLGYFRNISFFQDVMYKSFQTWVEDEICKYWFGILVHTFLSFYFTIICNHSSVRAILGIIQQLTSVCHCTHSHLQVWPLHTISILQKAHSANKTWGVLININWLWMGSQCNKHFFFFLLIKQKGKVLMKFPSALYLKF